MPYPGEDDPLRQNALLQIRHREALVEELDRDVRGQLVRAMDVIIGRSY